MAVPLSTFLIFVGKYSEEKPSERVKLFSINLCHTAYKLYGSNLVMLLDDQASVFVRNGGVLLLPLCPLDHMVRHPRCVFLNYNWINQLSNTTIWWLNICCLLHRYQLHVSALTAIFRLID